MYWIDDVSFGILPRLAQLVKLTTLDTPLFDGTGTSQTSFVSTDFIAIGTGPGSKRRAGQDSTSAVVALFTISRNGVGWTFAGKTKASFWVFFWSGTGAKTRSISASQQEEGSQEQSVDGGERDAHDLSC